VEIDSLKVFKCDKPIAVLVQTAKDSLDVLKVRLGEDAVADKHHQAAFELR
jgi:hypothetical protein